MNVYHSWFILHLFDVTFIDYGEGVYHGIFVNEDFEVTYTFPISNLAIKFIEIPLPKGRGLLWFDEPRPKGRGVELEGVSDPSQHNRNQHPLALREGVSQKKIFN